MKLTKRQLKRIIKEEYRRINRRNVIRESYDDDEEDEIIEDFESETMYITQYANGFVQLEKKDNIQEVIDFDHTEIPAVIAALQKMELYQ